MKRLFHTIFALSIIGLLTGCGPGTLAEAEQEYQNFQTELNAQALNGETPQPTLAGPVISNVEVSKLTQESIDIAWDLDQPSTGVVLYGTSDQFSLSSAAEISFRYIAHRQSLRNLSPDTDYYFQVVSTNVSGAESRSETFIFRTASAEESNVDSVPPDVAAATPMIESESDESSTPDVAAATPMIESESDESSTPDPADEPDEESVVEEQVVEATETDTSVEDINENSSNIETPQPTVSNPIISDVHISKITEESVEIEWSLDQASTGVILYGTSEQFSLSSTPENSFIYNGHRQTLRNLSSDTDYFFQIVSSNESGAESRSVTSSFRTASAEESNLESEPPEVAAATPLTGDEEPVVEEQVIDAIGDNTSAENAGDDLLSSETPQPVHTGPIISNVQISKITEESVEITWSLDQPSTGLIEYGTTDQFSLSSTPENSFIYSGHRQTLKNLSPDTDYLFQVISSNESGTESRSETLSFRTASWDEEPTVEDETTDVTGDDITAEEIAETPSDSETPQSASAAPIISNVQLSNITEESVEITWSLDQPSTGVIEYGTSSQFTLASAPENSYIYSGHRQTLKNLSPDTDYFFQVISSNESAEESRSETFSFRTALGDVPTSTGTSTDDDSSSKPVTQPAASGSANVTSEGWPSVLSNDSLPLAGVFYGNYKAGLSSGNGPLAAQNAIRFRAERTGVVDAVRYNNRRILPTDIADRCELYGPGSDWCECEDNGLDNWSCGYTLSNAYHVGSGGVITVELRNDDGTANHLPGGTVLGKTDSYQPALMSAKFPTLSLQQPVQVEAGQIYHMVFRNDKPPTCKVRKLSVEEAAACPRGEGAISMNGTKHSGDESEGSRFGPTLGDISGRVLYKSANSNPWLISSDVIGFYELKYTDGEYVGNSYTGYLNSNFKDSKGGSRVIEGSTRARQSFTVENSTREVDGVWLNYGHAYDRPASGLDLLVTLNDVDGNALASSTLPASMACSTRAQDGASGGAVRATRDEWMCRKWGYAEFPQPVSLLEGSTYSIEFSAPLGAAYALSSYFSVHRLPERNMWENAQAEISRDGGASWDLWTGNYFSSRDLPAVFTIVGMPRSLP